jgi:hypothetical protein
MSERLEGVEFILVISVIVVFHQGGYCYIGFISNVDCRVSYHYVLLSAISHLLHLSII